MPSSSATKFLNENELREWLRECCGCGPPTVVVEAGSLPGPDIVCTVDEGMKGIVAEDDCVRIRQEVRRDIEEVYKRLNMRLENGYSISNLEK